MKNIWTFFFIILTQIIYSQIQFGPAVNHSYENYIATISGSGTIYFTVDGTEPNRNSASAINQVYIPISQNLVVKAKLKNYDDQWSSTTSRPYFIGELPQKTIYFKPPANWDSVCSYMNFIQPEFMVDFWGPGENMTTACEGWFKASYGFYEASITFNNCIPLAPNYQVFETSAADTIFYDYSLGPITNPPICLLGVSADAKNVIVVKVYPNPVKDTLLIKSEKVFSAYEIIEGSGKSLGKHHFESKNINITHLSAGTYFMKLNSSDEVTVMVKFIKK